MQRGESIGLSVMVSLPQRTHCRHAALFPQRRLHSLSWTLYPSGGSLQAWKLVTPAALHVAEPALPPLWQPSVSSLQL